MGAVTLDASVAIGFLDPGDIHHQRAVSTLRELDRSRLLLPASAYSETLVRPLAVGLADRVDDFIDGLRVEVVPLDRGIAHRAAELRVEHDGLRLPDALVLATARLRETRLFSFDDRLCRLTSGE